MVVQPALASVWTGNQNRNIADAQLKASWLWHDDMWPGWLSDGAGCLSCTHLSVIAAAHPAAADQSPQEGAGLCLPGWVSSFSSFFPRLSMGPHLYIPCAELIS